MVSVEAACRVPAEEQSEQTKRQLAALLELQDVGSAATIACFPILKPKTKTQNVVVGISQLSISLFRYVSISPHLYCYCMSVVES